MEEKGIPYAVSYAVADIVIGILVDKGIGKLRGLDKADDLSKISTKIDDVVDVADDVADVTKVVDKIDDAVDAAKAVDKIDDVADAAKAVDKAGEVTLDVPKTIPQELARDGQVPAIGKMKDLNTPGNVVEGEFKVADYLPDMGTPKDNWHQNSGILRSVMNEGVPIKDVSMFPMDNAGFLGAERNLLQSRGWTYLDGYWYPPQ